jgi:hypothetical protein
MKKLKSNDNHDDDLHSVVAKFCKILAVSVFTFIVFVIYIFCTKYLK